MKLVRNWKKIALKSHSMWAAYLGLALLVVPEIAFLTLGHDVVSPYLTGYGGVALLAYGALGRLKDQGIDRD